MPTYVSSNVNAGDTVLATHYNNLRTDAMASNVDSARVYSTTSSVKTITNGVETTIEFEQEAHDTSSLWVSTSTGTPPERAKISRTATDDALYQFDLQINVPDVHATLDDITVKLYRVQVGGSPVVIKTHIHKFNESVSSGQTWVGVKDMYGDTGGTTLGSWTGANARAIDNGHTNFVSQYIPFPQAVDTTAFFTARLPYYDTSNIGSDNTFKVHWYSGFTTGYLGQISPPLSGLDVRWNLQSFNLEDDKGLNGAFANSTSIVSSTNNTNSTYDLNVDSINFPVSGGLNPVVFAITREGSHALDTMIHNASGNADARLIGVEIDYKPVIAHKHDETIFVNHMINETGNTTDWYYYYTIETTNTDPLVTTTNIGASGYSAYDLGVLQLWTGGV